MRLRIQDFREVANLTPSSALKFLTILGLRLSRERRQTPLLLPTNPQKLIHKATRRVSHSLNLWSLSPEADAALDMAMKELSQSTETTVSVSWSGGVPEILYETWTIELLLRVAAEFPDLVAEKPQRTR